MKSQVRGSSLMMLARSSWRDLIFGLLWVLFSHSVRAQTGQELTTLHEMKTLSPRQAAEGPAVRLKGVVVCFDAGWHQLYLHDGSETLYFNADDFTAPVDAGVAVEITGRARGTNVLEHPYL